MKTLRLKTVDAYVAFDFDCPTSAGGTRLAPDVTERETQLLARAMSYKFAVLETRFGGAKGAIRATPETRDDAVRRYVDEIRPMVVATKFLTATDLGTLPKDLESLPGTDQAGLMHTEYRGMPLDAYLTGLGVATAAEKVLGGLDGRTAAIEGFGKVGGATAVEMARRQARVVAPGANVPYTAGALEVLRERGIPALADFVCNAGATIGYVTEGLLRADEAVAAVEKRVRELTEESLKDPKGPVAGAARIAEAHLRTWLEPAQMPDGPALA